MSDATRSQLGRYRVLAELGRGAMGVVYKAQDPVINRTVAIKTILMPADEAERAEYEARFFQEAKAAGGLNHPGIITIHDVGREGDVAYMAMEMLDGVELREMMRRERLALPLALEIAAQIADALAFAHERGVFHRDIKPANVMVVRGRHAKIMDFGIARMQVSEVKTRTGMMLGSPKYMSPEQVGGATVDFRSDIFSLGVVIYELVTGSSPYTAREVGELMQQISSAAPPPPSAADPALPAMLDLIVARALEKDPAARYQSGAELAADLRACLAEPATRPRSEIQAATETPAPLDFDLGGESTVKVEPAAKTQAAGDAARTVKLVDAARTLKLGDATSVAGDIALSVSRRFDSAAALERLGHENPATVSAGTARLPRLLAKLRQDPDLRVVAIGVLAALAAAILIAVI